MGGYNAADTLVESSVRVGHEIKSRICYSLYSDKSALVTAMMTTAVTILI